MKHAHRTDFLFIGVAIVPAVLVAAGHLEAIFLLFLPLLIIACLCGMYEQKMEQIEQREAGAGHADVPAMHSGA